MGKYFDPGDFVLDSFEENYTKDVMNTINPIFSIGARTLLQTLYGVLVEAAWTLCQVTVVLENL